MITDKPGTASEIARKIAFPGIAAAWVFRASGTQLILLTLEFALVLLSYVFICDYVRHIGLA